MKAGRAKTKTEQKAVEFILQNPILGKYLNKNNFDVIVADDERRNLANKFGGGGKLEAWVEDDEGVQEYSHPELGKRVVEIYDKDILKNQNELNGYVFRDTQHYLNDLDPKWKTLRKRFSENFSQKEKSFLRQKYIQEEVFKKKSFNDWMEMNMVDGYIRGGFDEPSEYGELYNSGDKDVYTDEQRKIIERMRQYLGYKKQVED